jgi:predicted metal-binding membrane protein
MEPPADLRGVKSSRWWRDRSALLPATALVVAAAAAWVAVVRHATAMRGMADGPMAMNSPLYRSDEAAAFVVAWGVMMAAMMLPSAVPMVAMYDAVRRAMTGRGGRWRAATAVFAVPYALVWLATGLPVYAASAAVSAATEAYESLAHLAPYGTAVVLVGAGGYQFTAAKRACLRVCRGPLDFLARRWRPGVAGAARMGLAHAGYCLGCCWALMVVLVAAGAMGLVWVVLIAVLAFGEKLLPHGEPTAQVAGVALIGLGLAVAVIPGLASVLAG